MIGMRTSCSLAFVDTLLATEQARDLGYQSLWSDNPLLASDPKVSLPTGNSDALVSQDEANYIGGLALQIADAVDDQLRKTERNLLPSIHSNLGSAASRVLSALLYRGLAASRASRLSRPDKIGVWTAEENFLSPVGYTMSVFHNPVASLAKRGFFGNTPAEVFVAGVSHDRRADADYPNDWWRRLTHLPAGLILELFMRRLVLNRSARNKQVVVLGENEALRETLPFLQRLGIEFTLLGKLKPQSITTESTFPKNRLGNSIEQHIRRSLKQTRLFSEVECGAFSLLMGHWYEVACNRAALEWPATLKAVAATLPEGESIVLTNGLFGPSGALQYNALRQHGATVVAFEHGVTTGLSSFAEASVRYSEVNNCDILLCCSDRAARSFDKGDLGQRKKTFAVGLADQTRKVFRLRLQRALARRQLGLRNSDTVVLHVSTYPFFGNLRPGYGAPTETFVANTERELVQHVYGQVRHRIIYKSYPAERFPHEPSVVDRLKPPINLSFAPPEDLRYLRMAADVIVTSAPTSTFGWVAGAGVPVVWLASKKVCPLASSILDQAFNASFLCVDIDENGWQDRLVALLDRPLAAIQHDWEVGAAPRAALLEQAVFGPPEPTGERAARIVAQLANAQT